MSREEPLCAIEWCRRLATHEGICETHWQVWDRECRGMTLPEFVFQASLPSFLRERLSSTDALIQEAQEPVKA